METHLEEFQPKVIHRVVGKENDAEDALSRLDIADNDKDEFECEQPNPPVTYKDEVNEQIQLLFPLVAEQEMKPDMRFYSVCKECVKRAKAL